MDITSHIPYKIYQYERAIMSVDETCLVPTKINAMICRYMACLVQNSQAGYSYKLCLKIKLQSDTCHAIITFFVYIGGHETGDNHDLPDY